MAARKGLQGAPWSWGKPDQVIIVAWSRNSLDNPREWLLWVPCPLQGLRESLFGYRHFITCSRSRVCPDPVKLIPEDSPRSSLC